MSLLKSNSVQIGQSVTATNNFTLSVPSSPDGTIKLARGNSGATTQDILTVNSSGAVTLTNGGTITSAAAQASTSGTAIDFTGIPSWAKRITVMLSGVSGSGTSNFMIQLGDSGGVETTSYTGSVNRETNILGFSDGFILMYNNLAATTSTIQVVISNVNANNWVCSFVSARSDNAVSYGAGAKTLSDVLTQVRITTVNGTDTFDAGTINIMYEG
jgi:hypothetical protein